jgi:probable addiction module killer protein
VIEIFRTDVYLKWFNSLKSKKIQAILDMHIERMRFGNFGNSKPIGKGLSELKISYQAGFRIYYKNQNGKIVILLCGGDKSTQKEDILKAHKIAQEILG